MPRKPREEVEDAKIPSWVVSFGDMITNLLACFVMMQAFATTQDKTLFNAGMGSYRRAIEQCGLPDWLFGKQEEADFDYRKIKYPTPSDDTKDKTDRSRIIDLQEKEIRKAFARLTQSMETRGRSVQDKLLALRRLNIEYAPGAEELSSSGRAALKQLTTELRQGLVGQRVRLCVIGVATAGPPKGRWVLSARRAREAEQYLRRELASELRSGRLELISWGAGEGRDWCRKAGMDRPRDSILLAITRMGAYGG